MEIFITILGTINCSIVCKSKEVLSKLLNIYNGLYLITLHMCKLLTENGQCSRQCKLELQERFVVFTNKIWNETEENGYV